MNGKIMNALGSVGGYLIRLCTAALIALAMGAALSVWSAMTHPELGSFNYQFGLWVGTYALVLLPTVLLLGFAKPRSGDLPTTPHPWFLPRVKASQVVAQAGASTARAAVGQNPVRRFIVMAALLIACVVWIWSALVR